MTRTKAESDDNIDGSSGTHRTCGIEMSQRVDHSHCASIERAYK